MPTEVIDISNNKAGDILTEAYEEIYFSLSSKNSR